MRTVVLVAAKSAGMHVNWVIAGLILAAALLLIIRAWAWYTRLQRRWYRWRKRHRKLARWKARRRAERRERWATWLASVRAIWTQPPVPAQPELDLDATQPMPALVLRTEEESYPEDPASVLR